MTNNTIHNVPRELLAELQEHIHCHHDAVLWGKVCDLLSTPSPAGVDGLNTDRNAAFKACPESGCDWGSFYLGWKARGEVEQAIIDGLRGDAAALSGRHTLATVALNYDSTDTGFCRVYYRNLRELFAYQMTQRGQFALFACTRDGEPSHEVDYKQVDQLPRDYPEFAVWATDNNLVA